MSYRRRGFRRRRCRRRPPRPSRRRCRHRGPLRMRKEPKKNFPLNLTKSNLVFLTAVGNAVVVVIVVLCTKILI